MSKYQIRYSNIDAEDVGTGLLLGDIAAPDYAYYDASLDEEINTAGTLTFTLLPTNPALSQLSLRSTTIMLYRDGVEIWRGRMIRTETDMYNRKVITCEGPLAWFYDILSKGMPHTFYPSGQSLTPGQALGEIFTYYRGACSKNRLIDLAAPEPNRTWLPPLDDDYISIFELLSQLKTNSGGFYKIGYNSDNEPELRYLDYPTSASGQPVTFGFNLFDIATEVDVSEVATTLLAEDAAGHTVTVTNAAMEAAFGKAQAYHYFSDCTSASELASLAQAWFQNNCLANTTLSVAALDLNLTDAAYEAFYIGQPVRVVSEPHGIDTMMILTGLKTNISNPEASQMTLGAIPKGLTSYIKSGSNNSSNESNVSGGKSDSVSTITPNITQTGGNSTLAVTAARKYGKVVEIGFHISVTGNVAEGDNIWSGTLSNYLPVAYISTAAYYGVATPSAGVFRITAAGDVNFRLVKGALDNGAEMYCGVTYITEA